jgi:hypothetical protein
MIRSPRGLSRAPWVGTRGAGAVIHLPVHLRAHLRVHLWAHLRAQLRASAAST